MTSSMLQTLAVLLWLAILPSSCSQGPRDSCEKDVQCGWNSFCEDGRCDCVPGYRWSSNKHDCIDLRCQEARCLDCSSGADKCRRCVDYIEEGTGRCLDKCHGSYMLVIEGVLVGKVCPVSLKSGMMRVYVAIIIGIGAGIVMSALAALCFYWQTRESKSKTLKPRPPTRNEIEVVQEAGHTNKAFANVYSNGHIPNGSGITPNGSVNMPNGTSTPQTVAQNHTPNSSTHKSILPPSPPRSTTPRSNQSSSSSGAPSGNKVKLRPTVPPPPPDLSVFRGLVSEQRLYVDTFLAMLREVKERNEALPEGDNRGYVYKNVIHQLCRVLTLLNSDDEYMDIPPDGVLLLRWSNSLLHKYLAIKDPEYWEPGTPVGTLTSTFKPDLRLIPNGKVPGTPHDNAFSYERCDPDDILLMEDPVYRELSIQLENDFTEPIEV